MIKENVLHIQCIQYFNFQYSSKLILHHSPNENPRGLSNVQAINYNRRMKQYGCIKGFPDLYIFNPSNQKSIFIELKVGKNKLTDNQQAFFARVNQYQECAFLCYTLEQFVNVIETHILSI